MKDENKSAVAELREEFVLRDDRLGVQIKDVKMDLERDVEIVKKDLERDVEVLKKDLERDVEIVKKDVEIVKKDAERDVEIVKNGLEGNINSWKWIMGVIVAVASIIVNLVIKLLSN